MLMLRTLFCREFAPLLGMEELKSWPICVLLRGNYAICWHQVLFLVFLSRVFPNRITKPRLSWKGDDLELSTGICINIVLVDEKPRTDLTCYNGKNEASDTGDNVNA